MRLLNGKYGLGRKFSPIGSENWIVRIKGNHL